MESVLGKATDLAIRAHKDQKRKYGDQPYIHHPLEVAAHTECLYQVPEYVVAAAWLHDVLEDCDDTFCLELVCEMPVEVVKLVQELTNPSKGSKAPRSVRKQMDRDHLKNVSAWAKKIKLIDRTCNLKDMDQAPKDFLKLYLQESELLLEALQGADDFLEKKLAEEIQRRKDGLQETV